MQLPDSGKIQKQLRTTGGIPPIIQIEHRMAEYYIFAMASGQVGDELKFYFHCQLADKSGYALAEVVFKQGLNQVTATLKTTRGDLGAKFTKKFEEGLSLFTFA